MKTILLVFLFTLVTTSLAVTLKAKSKAILKALSENLDSGSSYQTAFKSLLQLTTPDEYDEVAEVLNAVKDEITALLNINQQNLDSENVNYKTLSQQYQDNLNSLNNQLTEVQDLQNNNRERRTSLQEAVQNAGQVISEATSALEQEKERRAGSARSYGSNSDAIAQAKAQCDQAISLLKEVEAEDLPSRTSSFVEVRRKELHRTLLQVEVQLKKVNTNSPINPFLKTLIEIAQDTVNKDVIAQIISLIQDLKNSLQKQQDSLDAAEKNDQKSSQSIVANYQSTISAEERAVESNQNDLVKVTAEIDIQSERIQGLEASIETAGNGYNNLDESHGAKVASLQGYLDRLKNDIAAIDQALAYLQSQSSEEAETN